MSKTTEQIAALNMRLFGDSDPYSSEPEVQEHEYLVIREEGQVISYLLFRRIRGMEYFEGLRSGTHPDHRRKGLATKLYKRLARKAKKEGIPYWTYTASWNLASINAHINIGMEIRTIYADEDDNIWVELIYNKRG